MLGKQGRSLSGVGLSESRKNDEDGKYLVPGQMATQEGVVLPKADGNTANVVEFVAEMGAST